jgi:hypothetical protein
MADYDLPTRTVRYLPTGARHIINARDFNASVHEDWTEPTEPEPYVADYLGADGRDLRDRVGDEFAEDVLSRPEHAAASDVDVPAGPEDPSPARDMRTRRTRAKKA